MACRRREDRRLNAEYDYDYDDLLRAYAALGVTAGKLVYVGSDLTRLMRYKESGREALLGAHLRALQELVGPEGTIFVPTSTLHLCNTEEVFDPASTPSSNMGVFAEYVRRQPEATRSFHPFWSLAGIGARAAEILRSVPRHAYGWGSVWHKFVELDVLGLNIGRSPHYSISVIHYVETVVGVPYRYTKEFIHPVRHADGTISREPFYLAVTYRDMDIQRDHNEKIFAHFEAHGTMRREPIGRGHAWSFSHREFFDITARLFLDDIYVWLKQPPDNRPYQH